MIKRIGIIWCLILLAIGSVGADERPTHLRVITYNIWDGFEGDSDRHARFVEFMKQEKPDVASLDELVGFKESDLKALAQEYGHSYVAIVKEEGYPMGITSKYPIEVVTKQVEGYWHGMLHVRTAGLDWILTHLSPFEWSYRLKEARQIVSYIDQHQLTDYLLMGDLNAFSPLDADELATKDSLLAGMQAWDNGQETYRNLREGRYDYSVISTLLAAGMEDVLGRLVHPASARITYPAAFLYGKEWGDAKVNQQHERLDYIFVSSPLMPACVGAKAYNGPEAEGISDHYPVRIDLNFNNKTR